ncbi:MAG: HAMP domain-containing protein [Syntrophomonadaceae bacterium]|nr:HAMP domain-containing protein [Syntrophomonadaceae bacterium]
MTTRGRIITFILLLLASIAVAGAWGFWLSNYRVECVGDTALTDDAFYFINDNDRRLAVIKADLRGEAQAQAYIKKYEQNIIRTMDDLTIDSDGQVYVYVQERNLINNETVSERVYKCDFESSGLIPAWDLFVAGSASRLAGNDASGEDSVDIAAGDVSARNCLSVTVRDGILHYFTIDNDPATMSMLALLHQAEPGMAPRVYSTAAYDIAIGFTELVYTRKGDIVFSTPEGHLYRAGADGLSSEQLYPVATAAEAGADPAETAPSRYYSTDQPHSRLVGIYYDGANAVYITDIYQDAVMAVNTDSGEVSRYFTISERFPPETPGYAYNDLNKRSFTAEGNFISDVDTANGIAIGVFNGNQAGSDRMFYEITRTDSDKWKQAGLALLAIWLALGVIFLLYRLFLLISGGRVPLVSKMLLIAIPLIIVCMMCMRYMIDQHFSEQIEEYQIKQLFLLSQQQQEQLSAERIKSIDIENPFNSVYYYELRQMLTALPAQADIYNGDNIAAEDYLTVHNFSYNWMYIVRDGEPSFLFCDEYYIDMPAEYYIDRTTMAAVREAIDQKREVSKIARDIDGSWIKIITPIQDETGEVVAILNTGTTVDAMNYAIRESSEQLSQIEMMIMLALVIILSILLIVSLWPLRRLEQSVQDIINGELGSQVPVRGRDEIAQVSATFNQMSLTIENQVQELTSSREGYYRFVPARMFEMLRKASITDVQLGNQTREEVTVFTFSAVDFDDIVSTMNGESMFGFINNIYSNTVPLVTANGGVIDRFINAGLLAFFTGPSEEALNAAISIGQRVDELNAAGALGLERPLELTCSLCYGPVMIGIVGHEKRLSAATVSRSTNMTAFLNRKGAKYGARILTTADVINRIDDFDQKYRARFIGLLSIDLEGRTEKLYDVYDGDREDIRDLKQRTRELFERGVNLYCAREFYEARLVFIEVLKQFRQDAAAREYLYLSDQHFQKQDTSEVDICIEHF